MPADLLPLEAWALELEAQQAAASAGPPPAPAAGPRHRPADEQRERAALRRLRPLEQAHGLSLEQLLAEVRSAR